MTAALDSFGGLDRAFSNAGYGTAGVPLHEIPRDVFERTLAVNVGGVRNCPQARMPAMPKNGGGATAS
ncbi:hypothetical protein GCM10009759_62000 [Kitasatospora saccharophila]|uniref:Short subunit dehydrogenase n=1 Tax=Kitasatospora saccharophila TaxID=407973 RepID=A0ABP5JDC3_9ACTN